MNKILQIFNYDLPEKCKPLLVILGIVCFIGVWLAVTGIVKYPLFSYRRTVIHYKNSNLKKITSSNSIDDFCKNLSKRFVDHIGMTALEEAEMTDALLLSTENMTPKEYKAYCLTVGGLISVVGVFIGILPGLLLKMKIMLWLGVILVGFGFVTYFIIKKKIVGAQKNTISGIETELPRFVNYIVLALRSEDRGVLAALERYTPHNAYFVAELGQTIADAKTSDFESAMLRWDARIHSDKLRMVLTGLISANNGDDMSIYFAMLEKDMNAYEMSLLKQNIKKIPEKMRFPKMAMYCSVFATFFFPIVMQVVESFTSVFVSSTAI